MSHSNITVYGALAANIAITILKFIAAVFTGSSAMLSEGIHSTVDSANQLLLLLGIHRSKKPPNKEHPFGHGKEIYFWSLIVSILIFGLGGGMSIFEGIKHIQRPEELTNIAWKKALRGDIDVVHAQLIAAQAQKPFAALYPVAGLHERALELALELGHPVYDCVYLACAGLVENGYVVTADQRFCSVVANGRYAGLVRSLSDVGP